MGKNDPTVVRVLAGRTPLNAARDLVRGSKLNDIAVRKSLIRPHTRMQILICFHPHDSRPAMPAGLLSTHHSIS
jgi:hypothetical protein